MGGAKLVELERLFDTLRSGPPDAVASLVDSIRANRPSLQPYDDLEGETGECCFGSSYQIFNSNRVLGKLMTLLQMTMRCQPLLTTEVLLGQGYHCEVPAMARKSSIIPTNGSCKRGGSLQRCSNNTADLPAADIAAVVAAAMIAATAVVVSVAVAAPSLFRLMMNNAARCRDLCQTNQCWTCLSSDSLTRSAPK